MAAITNRLTVLRSKASQFRFQTSLTVGLQAAVMLVLAQRTGWWPLALVVVGAAEWWRRQMAARPVQASGAGARAVVPAWLDQVPVWLMGASAVLIIAASPRLVTQVGVAVAYLAWRLWWAGGRPAERASSLINLLVLEAVVFEAVFLMAAVWRSPSWLVLILVWATAYVSVYAALRQRHERAAGVLAAAWAVVAVEIGWVLLLWLFTYTMTGGYLLVPQPALILTALGYCFGSIYVAQREGSLTRMRLAEYLLIGVVLVGIVVIGTSWHGTI